MLKAEFTGKRSLRTYRLKDFLNERFDVDVRKMPLHSYLGCPHREAGGIDSGCIYCYEPGFSGINTHPVDIDSQIRALLKYANQKGYRGKFLAYFQTGTNTYGERKILESIWKPILKYPDQIVALAVATRPDCLSDEAIELLKDMSQHLLVWVELGLQSVHDKTLESIHRGHDFLCFESIISKLEPISNLYTCAHIILGLPGETRDEMLETILTLNNLKVDGVKMHHLQVPKHTQLEHMYRQGMITVYTITEYINLITDLLPHLSSDIVIHRLTGEIKNDFLIAPRWPLPKVRVVQLIEEMMKKKNLIQGQFVFK